MPTKTFYFLGMYYIINKDDGSQIHEAPQFFIESPEGLKEFRMTSPIYTEATRFATKVEAEEYKKNNKMSDNWVIFRCADFDEGEI